MNNNHNNLERRVSNSASALRVLPEGDGRTIEGYAAIYNSPSELLFERGRVFYEIIRPGAFDEVLNNDVRALFNHDPNHVLARTKSGTLTLWSDEKGLGFRYSVPESRDDILEMVRRGDVDQNSFSFRINGDDEEWRNEDGKNIRYLNKIAELRDITLATYPAYLETYVSVAARSFEEWTAKNTKENPDLAGLDIDKTKDEIKRRERVLTLHRTKFFNL